MPETREPTNRAEGDVDRLVHERFFPGQAKGVFVDVGAARPDFLSISQHFRSLGWRVVCVEPNPDFAALHRERGHEVYEVACGPEDKDEVEFSVVDSKSVPYEGGKVSFESFSSLSLKEGYAKLLPPTAQVKKIRVPLRRLDTVLASAGVAKVDIVSIDVEGWELDVLAGLDLEKFRPSVLIVENFLHDATYQSRIGAMGYPLWRTLHPNQVYVREDVLRGQSWTWRLRDWLDRRVSAR